MILTSGDLFKAALRKCGGVIAEGEVPSQELMEDTRETFNIMLDSWSAENLSVYTTQDQQFTWPSGYASRTLGPSGDFVGLRPVRLLKSSYVKVDGIDYPLLPISELDYNTLALKTSTSNIPSYIYLKPDSPNATIYIYPVPDQDIEFHFMSPEELAQVDDLFTNIVLPPGYRQAFIFNLAVLMCVELGLEAPPTTKRIAITSKRTLKANNSPNDYLQMPSGIVQSGGSSFDINIG